MTDVERIIADYVAVWNEVDADVRRRRIRALWTAEGTSCYRLLDARGYQAIEARVIGSWNKWLSERKYAFRARAAVAHHNVVKFDWVMVRLQDRAVAATGLSFLILDANQRIIHDYQFNPTVDDATTFVRRYLAALNEPDASVRSDRVAELWASDGKRVSEASVCSGHAAIASYLTKIHEVNTAQGLAFAPVGSSQAHHEVVTFKRLLRLNGSTVDSATVCHLLVLDEAGHVRLDYLFDEADIGWQSRPIEAGALA